MTKDTLQQVLDAVNRAGIGHNNKAGGQWLLVSTDDQLVALRAALTATTNEAAAQAEARLTEDARVGHCTFSVGVPERMVIEAAQRAAKHPQGGISEEAGRELRQMIADNAGRAAFLESHPAVSEELARLIEENERLSAALATQPVQAHCEPDAWRLQFAIEQGWADAGLFESTEAAEAVAHRYGSETRVIPLYAHPAPTIDRGLSEAQDVLSVVNQMALAGHINDKGVAGEACQAIKAALAASAPSQAEPNSLLEWACWRWREEVQDRPLVNVHRRTLDDTWRQVVRHAGGDPDALLGPSHDTLVSKGNANG